MTGYSFAVSCIPKCLFTAKHTMISKAISHFLFVITLVALACTNDVLPPPQSPAFCDDIAPTYNADVKPIMEESCTYAGCHNGAGGVTSTNYTSYNLLLPILNNGDFRSRVLGQKKDPVFGMPPDRSVYSESLKDDLTEEELQIIECWLNDGFPQK